MFVLLLPEIKFCDIVPSHLFNSAFLLVDQLVGHHGYEDQESDGEEQREDQGRHEEEPVGNRVTGVTKLNLKQ